MGLGDLRHEQHGQTAQQPEGKGEQRQGHALEHAVLFQRRRPAPGPGQVDGQAGGHQHVLCRVQRAGQHPAALHRPQDVPQAAGGLRGRLRPLPAEAPPHLAPAEQGHEGAAHRLAQGGGPQHQRAALPGIPARCGVQGRRHRPDAHRLLGQLADHVGANPPPGQKEPPQHRRHGHPRQAQRRQPQRARRSHIPQPPFCRQPRKARLCRHGQHPQPGPQRQQTPQHAPGRRRVPAQLLGEQAGGRHRDARRSQRDEQPVHRQHQLVQAHALAAQRVGQPDAQPQPRQTQHHVRPGEQGRVLPVVWPVFLPHAHPSRRFSALLPAYAAPAQNMSGGMGCFAALFMV